MMRLTAPAEIKALGDQGEFEGYASIFGNIDEGGDVVERGAFKELVLTKDGFVRVLNQHNMNQPIGKAKVHEDERGLAFAGSLVLEVPQARQSYALMKAGITDGMSIGYDVRPGGSKEDGRVRRLTDLKLWEISVVTFGMNPAARIETVKALEQINSIRTLEDYLRDVGMFSKEDAKAIASGGFKALQTRRDDGDAAGAGTDLAALLRGTSSIANHWSSENA